VAKEIIGEPEGRPRPIWEGSLEMNLKATVCELRAATINFSTRSLFYRDI
jgi:hypothetical protein